MLHIWPLVLGLGPTPGEFEPRPVPDRPSVDRPTTPRGTPVYGGTATGDDPAFDAVVYVLAGSQGCTGIAVAPQLVLTAAHCLQASLDPADVEIRFGAEPFRGGVPRTVASAYAPHPDYCEDCDEDIHDIAWIRTSGEIVGVEFPTFIADPREYRALMGRGEPVTIVGYGESDDGVSTVANPVRYAAEAEVRRFSDSGAEFFAGGDGVDTCRGDSGGPALVSNPDGGWYLVGLTSRGTTECGGGGYYTAPLPELCWVRDDAGVDLVPPGCGACDCVDLGRTGCDCRLEGRAGPSGWLGFGFAAFFAVRRRRRAVS